MMWFLPQASPIELVHLAFALLGLTANFVTVLYAIGDLLHVRRFHMGWPEDESLYRQFVSHRNLREELARFALNTVFVSIGIVSISNPPPPSNPVAEELTFQLRYTRIALTGASLLLTFKSVKDLTDRRSLQAMMRKQSPFKRT
jgi:hypothetical protein